MPDGAQGRGRSLRRWGQFPTERDWERSVLLQPIAAPYEPALISDGAGPPFAPAMLDTPAGQLDPDDPATAGLVLALANQKPAADGTRSGLEQWRLLARTENEALFARGMPPHMVTVAMRPEGRRGRWVSLAVTRDGSLRSIRDGIRASRWRLDPDHPPGPQDTIVRMLVTEQTRSGGELADKRLLAPDLYDGDEEVWVTMYVAPKPGVQLGLASATPETPVRIALPSPLGDRPLYDGGLYEPG